ncbi:MAG: hypothetical protein ACHP84_09635 [Caulobacterales bacterium]
MKELHVQLVILDDEDFLGHSESKRPTCSEATRLHHPVVTSDTNILKPELAVARRPLSEKPNPPDIAGIALDPAAPLVVVDVDEVLALFMRGFERFVGRHGLEMRIDRFALFQCIYKPGETTHLDLAAGRKLFDAFFEAEVEHIDPAPGAAEALKALSRDASIVILTNAPPQGREPRARWLAKHDLDYPMLINVGLKGPPAAALAALTSGPVAFIDDLLPNLDSVAADAPAVSRFQMVADERLRPLAFAAPDRHPRIDEWEALGPAIAEAIRR